MNTSLNHKIKKNIPLDYINTFITNLNMQSSIWVLYLAYCGMNLAQIGLLEGVYHATSIIFEVPSGAVADLLGRKKSMLLSRLCIAISCVLMMVSNGFWMFALSFFIQALGNNFNSGSEEALVYDSMKYLRQEESYVGVNGRLNMLIEISQGIATVAGGILAEYSYLWCYGACVVIALLAFLPVAFMTEVPMEERGEPSAMGETEENGGKKSIRKLVAEHFRTSFHILKSDARICKVIVYYSMVFAATTLMFFYSQQYYSDLGYNKIQISLILLLISGVSCLGAMLSEKIYGKTGKKIAFIGGFVIAATFLCYGAGNVYLAVAAFAVAQFFNSVLYPVQSLSLNELIPSEQRATLISVSSMFFSIAMILCFPIAGAFADRWGLGRVFFGLGILLILLVAGAGMLAAPKKG